MFSIDEARDLLRKAGVFYCDDPKDSEDERDAQTLNMNDTWGWALAWGEYVIDEELPEVARLFWNYGNCGILYWVSEKHDQMKSEFHDVNRFIEFVRQEEKIIKETPDMSARAYKHIVYTIGDDPKTSMKE